MITQEISLKIWGNTEIDILIYNFERLLIFYKNNGQIQSKNEPLYIESNFIKCNVFTLENDSLSKKYNTNWIDVQIKKIENLFLATPQIKFLGEIIRDDNSICICKKSEFYILTTNPLAIFGPIECGNCNKLVPLYKIDGLTQELKESIITWEENHQCYDNIILRDIVGVNLATEQIADFKSQLSSEGINISKELYKITGVPTYYYLLNNKKIEFKKESQLLCPSCNCEWFLKIPLHITYSYKCDKCFLISCFASYNDAKYKEII